MHNTQEIVELSGEAFSAAVLLSGLFSPLIFFLSLLWEALKRWL